MGKVIRFSERGLVIAGKANKNKPTDLGSFTVTGVLDDLPGKTHLDFHLLTSLATVASLEKQGLASLGDKDWKENRAAYHYILLDKAYDQEHLAGILDNISQNVNNTQIEVDVFFKLQPLSTITPGVLYGNPFSFRLPIQVIYFFGLLALIVLLSACLNYTSLSLAKIGS